MRIYVAGPVTGKEQLNLPAFEDAAAMLRESGYEAVIPHDHVPPDAEWHDAMRICIPLMLTCDGVALIDEWSRSEGARLEVFVAHECGLATDALELWVQRVTPAASS